MSAQAARKFPLPKEISKSIDLAQFETTLTGILQRFKAQTGTIHYLNPNDKHLYLVAASAGIPDAVMTAIHRIPMGKGIAGETAETKKPVSVCNLQAGGGKPFEQPAAKTTGVQGALCVPVFHGERVVGTLGVGWNVEKNLTPKDTDALLAEGKKLGKLFIEG